MVPWAIHYTGEQQLLILSAIISAICSLTLLYSCHLSLTLYMSHAVFTCRHVSMTDSDSKCHHQGSSFSHFFFFVVVFVCSKNVPLCFPLLSSCPIWLKPFASWARKYLMSVDNGVMADTLKHIVVPIALANVICAMVQQKHRKTGVTVSLYDTV